MDRTTLRNELVAVAFLGFVLGMFTTNALSRRGTFFEPTEPSWALILGVTFVSALAWALAIRIRRLITQLSARDA